MSKDGDLVKRFEEYQVLFERLPVGIHIYHLEDKTDDRTLRLVGANRTSTELTGIPVAEVVGKTLDENFPGLRDLGIPQQYAEVVRKGKSVVLDEVLYSDDRIREGAFAVSAFPLPEDCLGVCFENITERLESENKLRTSRRELQALFDNMLCGFAVHEVIVDKKGNPDDYIFLEVNTEFEKLTGLKRENIQGKRVTEVHPDIKSMDFDWIRTYGKVALSGESIRFEQFFQPQQKWYQISAYSPQKGYFALTFEDITSQKSLQKEVEEARDQWQELFERMPSGAVVYQAIEDGNDFIIKNFNRTAEKIEQIERGKVIGKRATEVFPGVKQFGLLDKLKNVWKTGQASYLPESLYQDNRTKACWRENWIYNLPSGDIVVIYNDVTERKNAEIKLNETLRQLRDTARAGNVGLWDWDLTTDRVTYSDEWKRQIGYESDEIQDHLDEWRSRVHPDDFEKTIAAINKSIESLSQHHTTEFRFRHKDGSYRWILVQAAVIPDANGKGVRMLGSHVDITERKKAEIALARMQKGVNSLIEGLIDSLVVTDDRGAIKFVNDSACRFFGKKRDDLLNCTFGYPLILDDVFEITAAFREESPVYGEAKATEVEWEGENVILISIRDITERKKVIQEQEKMNQQLQQIDKIESVGQLAGGVAHDFNNMLNVILGYSHDIYTKLKENDPLREDVKEIIDAGKRSASLTRQLLAFSRRQTLRPEVVDLNECVRNMNRMLHRLIGEDIELLTKLAKEPVLAMLDPGQMEQVIVNLVVNARDSMPFGGKIVIETLSVLVDRQYARTHAAITPGDYVMLSISDNGSGMDEETKSRIFEPFFSTKLKEKGTGLGLSTVYGIVKQLDGYIWVYSELGHGTTFKIYFPKSGETVPSQKTVDTSVVAKGHGQSILVVEDEPSIRKLCQRMLTNMGFRTIAAANGREALLLVEENGYIPDIIITDVVMPEMSGKVLVDRLLGKLPDLKVLYMSGYTDNAIVHHGVLDSGCSLLQKPFSHEDLARKVNEVIGSK